MTEGEGFRTVRVEPRHARNEVAGSRCLKPDRRAIRFATGLTIGPVGARERISGSLWRPYSLVSL